MKIKKEYSALVLIIIALSIYLILQGKDSTHFELPEMAPPAGGDITKLEFSSGNGSVTLERSDDMWTILPGGYAADGSLVGKMISAVEGFDIVTLASESGNYSVYDLDEDGKIALEVFSGEKKVLSLEIGKRASTYRHTFVRIGGEPGVYQAKGDLRGAFELDVEKLRDKSVFRADKEMITAFSVDGEEGGFELRAGARPEDPDVQGQATSVPGSAGKVWQGPDGTPVDDVAAGRFLSSLADIRCDRFINDMEEGGLGDPVFSVSVTAGPADTLTIFGIREEGYPAVSSQNEYPFFLSKWKAEQIINGAKELRPAPAGDSGGE